MSIIDTDARNLADQYAALVQGKHNNPFAILGVHRSGKQRLVRTFLPQARQVTLLDRNGEVLCDMQRVHADGIFAAIMPPRMRRYRLRVTDYSDTSGDYEDSYAFAPTLGALDLYLLGEGSDKAIYTKLGANALTLRGITGTRFAVWAPNASRVSVIGDFNDWDGRRHVMRLHPGNGIWEIFIPGVGTGAKYKFELLDLNGVLLPLKSDPFGHYFEPPSGNASIVFESRHQWRDGHWMQNRRVVPDLNRAVSIYEVHLGSWRRNPYDSTRYLTYRELAVELIPYVVEMGFTHIELLPVSEHPFDGSWGYQPIGMFAPTQRFGDPDDFREFVDCCHQSNISVILDWVPAHFPRDEHGLGEFDGTALYEHEDPRKGAHADWGTLIFNFGRREVVNYLIGNALYWVDEFHVDGIRVDAVASMLYLDYSRKEDEWIANEHGGNQNYEAVGFLKRLNTELHAHGAVSFAEESTAWPGVSHPVDAGGLGFTYKWNMGWMNDTLSYLSEESVHRKHHHDKMTFGLVYAFSENFVLPLSHDEVVHGKRSLLERMPGDDWQQFANLRAYFAGMYAHPGKKLLFMGSELAPREEWDHDTALNWELLKSKPHAGIQLLVRDLNALYTRVPALYERDFSADGFEWIRWDDKDSSVLSWIRRDASGGFIICVSNMTPVVRHDYCFGVPRAGTYTEILNTDNACYGGSNICNADVVCEPITHDGRPYRIALTLPPLATLILACAD